MFLSVEGGLSVGELGLWKTLCQQGITTNIEKQLSVCVCVCVSVCVCVCGAVFIKQIKIIQDEVRDQSPFVL